MAIVHAAPLIALLLLTGPAPASQAAVTLALGSGKGVVVVRNRTAREQWLSRALLVERRREGSWHPVPTNLRLVAECDSFVAPRMQPVRLRPGQAVTVQPWTGYDCDAQCAHSCKLNGYAGPGLYRVVALTWPGGVRIPSPPFAMPATPPKRREYSGPMDYQSMIDASKRLKPGQNDP